MKKIIYHGSNKIIEKPIYGYGKKYNDYGLGFYCTYEEDMAREWSVSLNKDGFLNQYEIELENLNILNLNDDKFNILNWLTLLLKNREFDITSNLAFSARQYLIDNFSISLDNIDIIIGYRADDSYFSFASDFLNGTISYRELKRAMMLGELGLQFVLISEKAFDRIRFFDAKRVSCNIWYKRKIERDQKARKDYFDSQKFERKKDDIYITNILNEEMKQNDSRLR